MLIFNVHVLLAADMITDPALEGRLRRLPVAISHSSCQLIDDPHKIDEDFEVLIVSAAAISDPFEQSFFLLVHIPCLQGFADETSEPRALLRAFRS